MAAVRSSPKARPSRSPRPRTAIPASSWPPFWTGSASAQESLQPADLDIVRRLARPLLYLGTAVAVLDFAKLHAARVGHYSFHTSSRLPWTLAYMVFLCLAAYAVG